MARSLQTQQNSLYGTPQGLSYQTVPPIPAQRAPTSLDVGYQPGQLWVDLPTNTVYCLTGVSGGVAVWVSLAANSGDVSTLDGDTGSAVPTLGVITLSGTSDEITTAASGSTVTFSVPTTFIAPGSIASTTSITAGNALTVTTGGATITAGGLTVTAGGAGITGTTNINTTGAAVTTLGTGGTGAIHIGNATGNTAVTGSLTASTTLTATLGAITATNGNLVLTAVGNKLVIHAGANCSCGTATLGAGGTVTVSNTAVTASSIIYASVNTPGGTQGIISVPAGSITASTSFVINSSNASDTSTVNWIMVN